MYNIEFYETIDGISELWEFLDDLQQKALTNKDARMQGYSIRRFPCIFSFSQTMVPGLEKKS